MARITENVKDGKVVSYRFIVCVGRDAHGKQVRRFATWHPPDGLRQSRMRAAAERAAEEWEQDVRKQYAEELERLNRPGLSYIPPEERRDNFVNFVNDVWFRLYICNGDRKRSTEAYYEDTTRYITDYFSGEVLQDITRCIYRNILVLIFFILTIVNLPKVITYQISPMPGAQRKHPIQDKTP